jgi:hypothetical protein
MGYYIEYGVKGAPTTPHLAIEYGDLDIFFYRDLMCSAGAYYCYYITDIAVFIVVAHNDVF